MQPPPSLKALGDPIYEVFYGFTEQPFAITTDPRFFYLSASHQRAYTEILNGLRRRESLLMITGETGTGKTTLCRAVLDALGDRTFSAIILNPYMTGAEVLRIILRDFGLVSHEELRRGGLATADVPQLLDALETFLRSLVPLGSHAVLVLDEAQSLTPAVLDQVRVLTSLEDHGRRLLQVVLCGQPGLLQTIKADALLALNERITRRVELTALPPDEIPGYIQHRLGVAGGSSSVRFDAAAMQAIADLSRGLPRRINVLCDRALQEGRVEGATTITGELVKRAARALAGVHEPLPVLPEPKPAAPVRAAERPVTEPGAAPVDHQPPREPVQIKPAAHTPPAEPAVAPAVSGFGPATVHPPMPAGGTRPDLAAPPSDRRRPGLAEPVPEASPTPARAASVPGVPDETQADTVRLPAAALAVPPMPGPAGEAAGDIGDIAEVFRSEPTTTPATPIPAAPAAASPPVAAAPSAAAPAAPGKASAGPPLAPAVAAPPVPPRPSAAPAAAVTTTTGTTSSMWPATEVEPDAAMPADAAADDVFTSFGVEKPREGIWPRRLAIAAAVVLAVAAIGYTAWSWNVRGDDSLAGPVPPRPVIDRGTPIGPRPVPAPEEIDALFRIRRLPWVAPRETPDDTPPLVETPPEAAMPIAPLP